MLPRPPERLGLRVKSFLAAEWRALAIVGLLCASVIVQTHWFRNSTSVTVDETFYLSLSIRSVGHRALAGGFMRAGVAPLPMILNYFPTLRRDAIQDDDRSHPWIGRPGDGQLIALPRLLTTLTSLVPLVALAFFWLKARRGLFAATFGAGLLAFSPTLLAHASLATLDSTFAFHATLATIAIGAYFRRPSRLRLVAAAFATSLAASAKYTGILLVPCFLLSLSVRNIADLLRSRKAGAISAGLTWSKHVRPGVVYFALTFVFTWMLHGFQLGGSGRLVTFREPSQNNISMRSLGPGFPGRQLAQIAEAKVEVPGFIRAMRFQLLHNRRGHPAFLMGMRSTQGWWYYFPVALLLKSTFAELFLVLSCSALLVFSLARFTLRFPSRDPQRAMLFLFGLALSVLLVRSHINIGHRYAIALYPVAVLGCTDLLAEVLAGRKRLLRTAGAALLATQVATSLATAPHYLSYFNRLAGGSDQGWKYLADSNIDWGQDLPALRRLIERE
ncbi:MAG TPA: hypothetical protein VGY53_11690, partial [Isosphaeraceae bacterium]|nr:hypothetical protein [Isosphaeraceae bacterium]